MIEIYLHGVSNMILRMIDAQLVGCAVVTNTYTQCFLPDTMLQLVTLLQENTRNINWCCVPTLNLQLLVTLLKKSEKSNDLTKKKVKQEMLYLNNINLVVSGLITLGFGDYGQETTFNDQLMVTRLYTRTQ